MIEVILSGFKGQSRLMVGLATATFIVAVLMLPGAQPGLSPSIWQDLLVEPSNEEATEIQQMLMENKVWLGGLGWVEPTPESVGSEDSEESAYVLVGTLSEGDTLTAFLIRNSQEFLAVADREILANGDEVLEIHAEDVTLRSAATGEMTILRLYSNE